MATELGESPPGAVVVGDERVLDFDGVSTRQEERVSGLHEGEGRLNRPGFSDEIGDRLVLADRAERIFGDPRDAAPGMLEGADEAWVFRMEIELDRARESARQEEAAHAPKARSARGD